MGILGRGSNWGSPRPVTDIGVFRRAASNEPDYACIPESTENSRWLRLESRTGETLKIYAKTNKRVRFELVHELRRASAFEDSARLKSVSLGWIIFAESILEFLGFRY